MANKSQGNSIIVFVFLLILNLFFYFFAGVSSIDVIKSGSSPILRTF